MAGTDILTTIITVLFSGGLLTLIFRNLNAKIDCKQDKSSCELKHEKVNDDMIRGQKTFDSMLVSINNLERQLADNNTQIALLNQTIKSFVGFNKRSLDRDGE